MRKNFGSKPFTYPQPVFIIAAYDEDGTPNVMNAAWGGISEMHEISICISEGHKTTANILKRKAFTVSMAEVGQVVACDYVGIVSGNRVSDKFARAGFHATRSEFVDAPLIDELSVVLECKLKDYNPETCILRGEIINVSVDERVLDENGKVDVSKVSPIIFDPFNNDYLEVGKKVGNAFSDGKRLK
ncbi:MULTISPECIES: flavin reductase family protein [Parabacteroides]|uniref:flavin reductase family protein n=1 Tax=Parabacteroides TaxID=375288 RepID=UPI000EFE6AC1|nr:MULTISPECIES: flavin reductase family protein [Parabacteroides]RHU30578.1 flavin reductase family protein [Parabacteroides sp. TM07-1AC]WFE83911.1 flavin reductase family protein [Parabacteroides chongii]